MKVQRDLTWAPVDPVVLSHLTSSAFVYILASLRLAMLPHCVSTHLPPCTNCALGYCNLLIFVDSLHLRLQSWRSVVPRAFVALRTPQR
jgi:hypothetical protein